MSATTKKSWTGDELDRLPAGFRYEIDEGQLVIMSPGGPRHSRLVAGIVYVLEGFARRHGAGRVYGGEFGLFVQHDPPVLRGLDVAFYSSERASRVGDGDAFTGVPPDLAVEVHLPDEGGMQRKVQQYLASGVRSVWVVDARERTLTQHRPGEAPRVVSEPGATVEEPVLPGFACRLHELFGEETE